MIALLAVLALQTPPVEVFGAGTKSCAVWTQQRRLEDNTTQGWGRLVLETWVLGFVTAEGIEHPGLGAGAKAAGAEGMFDWVDTYCAAHPVDDLSEAAGALAKTFVEVKK